MPTAKQAAREIIDRLPDQPTWSDIMVELYVKEKFERGLATSTPAVPSPTNG